MILVFHKPYGVLSQFTKKLPQHQTLADFGFPKDVYPLGRLDSDSEGLLLLSNEKKWNDILLNPRHAHERTYHAQVEGIPTEDALARLRKGILIQGYKTKHCLACLMNDPGYSPRVVPIRVRLKIPTRWIELKLIEGKNRQVRHMTSAVGFPTLRLIRVAIGNFQLGNLKPGKWRKLNSMDIENVQK